MKQITSVFLGLLIIGLALYTLPQPTGAQGNTPCYGSQGGAEMVAGSGCTYAFESGSRVQAKPHALTLTNGAVISDVYNAQLVTIAANVTATITTTGYVAGDTLSLVNGSNNTLLIVDSDPVKASGNISLGQYDTAALWFDGTYWLQTGESDN